jgi:aryl-alcohol dehydrogenase-like predicted oxidoreductase
MAPPVPRVALAPGYDISRLVKGGWQLAGGHGPVPAHAALDDMRAFVAAGITTFDCADIYTGVESLIGDFVRQRGHARDLQIHTKYVPDLAVLGTLTARDVARAVDRSLQRLGVAALDLVQFHWWDYDRPGLLDTAGWLNDQRVAGKIRHLGATNFNTPALQVLIDGGVPVVAHQVQYSLLDERPAGAMRQLCAARRVPLLCYGALAGGFLSERFLGAPEPVEVFNRSLVKYRLIIAEFGGWSRFQNLLAAVHRVAQRHDVSIGAVAIAWVLEQPNVAGVIVGSREARHLRDTLVAATLGLDESDRQALRAVLDAHPPVPGDVYDLERVKAGRHAAIMKYDLNSAASG